MIIIASHHACVQQKGWQQSVQHDEKQDQRPQNLPPAVLMAQQTSTCRSPSSCQQAVHNPVARQQADASAVAGPDTISIGRATRTGKRTLGTQHRCGALVCRPGAGQWFQPLDDSRGQHRMQTGPEGPAPAVTSCAIVPWTTTPLWGMSSDPTTSGVQAWLHASTRTAPIIRTAQNNAGKCSTART